ncbi:putative RNA polymerase sigma factor [Asanoa ishikariensis]|uniref:RNA polymerase sigma-70 factor, ECF subfamily n=1 Tax=Asanoa ishikariensis TaxID=137265 RepID=A0A1H3T7Z2_9ACTN|nr:sigma-70 family RNA polymerase sigma factor [Asanoa ishikariensis]GIF62920.1 putative RNA polymerase sigma factor [Asanoa ishikariensis]SDZ45971.1 RNA polymerase sigma-70 factor, ECF subfamily [Asanoa ishikariensis]
MDGSDEALVRRVAGGDEQALELLYARHAAVLLRYAVQLTADRGQAEEALQDTFVGVWQGAAARFAGGSTVRTWLFGICRRQAGKRTRSMPPPSLPLDAAASVPSALPTPDEIALARADVAAVGGALARLPAGHREVLHLTFVAELPMAEIATLLDIPLGTVKSRLFNARAALARALPVDQLTVKEVGR